LKELQKTSPEWAFISLGSNLKPKKHLPLAVRKLCQLGTLLRTSCVYQNPPIGRPEQADFLNAAALLETALTPLEIRSHLREIEKDLGRIRTEDKFAARTIDLDLCLLGELIMDTPEITLPDPDLLSHGYLAVPMAELAPDFRHPITGETLQQIADKLSLATSLTLREDITKQLKEAVSASS
jgi:2-amino-4-hydroxy-6-hydroxymethyldihydropteridine diphosphokinase